MISYDNYKNRIEKLAKAKKFILKFKFLILGVLALIIAGVTVILCIKGTVTAPLVLPARIVYGESYEPVGASAIMSGITYEYRAEGGEWKNEKPIKAGKYSVRAVSEKAFGAKGYGESVEYEILPKEAQFTINDDSLIYGDNPSGFTLSPLVYGDKLQKESLSFDFKDFLTEETDVTVDISSVKITDINGGDSSSCYKITADAKSVRLIERKLNVKPAAQTFVYRGEEISFENLASQTTLSALAKGDTLSFDTVLKNDKGEEISKPEYAGIYTLEAVPQSIKIFKGETDVTSRYGLSAAKESLTVTPKPITVKTAGKSREFNAMPLYDAGYTQQGLIEGHSLVRDSAPLISITDTDRALNVQKFAIFDGQSKEVTQNYAINYEYGTLEITPKTINVTTADAQKTYDGIALKNNNYQDDLNLKGYSLSLASFAQRKNAGEEDNVLTFSVSAPDGSDASRNFKINYRYGKLTVNRREITIKTESGSAVFNGNYFYKTNGTVISGTPLASGQQIVCAEPFGIKDVAYNVENKTTYKVKEGSLDVSGNYVISYIYGALTITPRPITVITATAGRVYNAQEFSDFTYTTRLYNGTQSGLVGGDTLSVVSYEKLVNAGTVTNKCVYKAPDGNYEIKSYEYGKLTVQPRPLTVVTATNFTHIYDATAFSDTGYETYYYGDTTEKGLLNGDALTLLTKTEKTNAGNYQNVCSYEEPNGNYAIRYYEYGTLRIQPRPLTVKTADAEKFYDGSPLAKPDGYSVEYYGDATKQALLNGDKITAVSIAQATDVSESKPNSCIYSAPSDYVIKSYEYGKLTVKPRPITVITATNSSHIYDATAFSDTRYQTHYYGDTTEKGLLNGDVLSITSYTEIINAETKINYCDYFCGSNYEIKQYEYGKLTVNPRPITVITATNSSHIYDATAFSDTRYQTHYYGDTTQKGLLNGDTLTVKTFTAVSEALQPAQNACTYAAGANYLIKDYEYGVLTVQPRPITVQTADVTKIYDATPLYGGATYNTHYFGNAEAAGLLGGDKLTLGFNDNIINVWENKPNESTFTEPNKNYVIKDYEYGALTITPRPLLVQTATASHEYDGTAFTCPQYRTYLHAGGNTAGLLGKDELVLLGAASVTNVWETQQNNNVCSFAVPNANYEIKEYEYGTLKIEKKWLSVIPYDCNTLYGSENTYLKGQDNYIVGYEDDITVSGEKLEIEVYFENANGEQVTPKNVGQYKIFVNGEKGKIYKNGVYFQRGIENYLLCPADTGVLTVKPRPITVKAFDVAVDYGTTDIYPITQNNFANAESCGLQYGETLQIIVSFMQNGNTVSPKNVGQYGIRAVERLTLIEGSTDTSNYDITYLDGALTINPKKITVELLSQSFYYGERAEYPVYENNFANAADCGLQYNERLTVYVQYKQNGVAVTPKNCGLYFASAIESQTLINGIACTDNYDITYSEGILRILQKQLDITLFDIPPVTYGTRLSYPSGIGNFVNPEGCGLVYGEQLEIEISFADGKGGSSQSPKNAGKYSYSLSSANIFDKDGNAIPQGGLNYVFSVPEKQTEILPKAIEVQPYYYLGSVSHPDLGVFSYLTYGDNFTYPSGAGNFRFAATCGLEYGDELEIFVEYEYLDYPGYFYSDIPPTDAGIYFIRAKESATLVNGVADTSNYDITYKRSQLKILPKRIEVELNDITAVYGEPLLYPEYNNNFKNAYSCGLQYNEALQIINASFDTAEAVPGVGSYAISASEARVFNADGTEGKISNYNVTYVGSTLTVIPRPITVVTNSAKKTYNGLALSDGGCKTYLSHQQEKSGLLNGDVLTALSVKEIVNVWETYSGNNVCEYALPNSNYEITEIIFGTLEISPKPIAVVLNDISTVLYGSALVYPAGINNYLNTSFIGLENGEQLEISVVFSQNGSPVTPKNAGEYDYSLNLDGTTVYDADNAEILNGINNYLVTCLDKTATISKRYVRVRLTGVPDTVYDGYPHPHPASGFVFSSGTGTAYNEALTLGLKYYSDDALTSETAIPKNAGKYYVYVDESACTASGESVYPAALNYRISCEGWVSFEIFKKALTVNLGNVSKDYDGEIYDFNNAPASSFSVNGLCGADQLKRTVTYSDTPLNAGTYTVTFDNAAFELSSGLTSNYYLDTSSGRLNCSLTINKRKIYIEVNERQTEFSGSPVNPAEESFRSYYAENNALSGFVKDDAYNAGAVYRYNGSLTPPSAIGRYVLSAEFTNTAVTDNYFIVTNTPAELVITARKVGVTAIYKNGTFYYNGEPAAISDFGFESWHDIENPAEGDEYGFAEEDIPQIAASAKFTFTDKISGRVYKDGATPVNAGEYKLEISVGGYKESEYFVTCYETEFIIKKRPLTVTLGNLETVYNNKMPDILPEITDKFSLDTLQDGLLAKDRASYSITHKFVTASGSAIQRYNAGAYSITAVLNRLTSEDNYVIQTVNKGTLTINRAVLYVKPQDKSEYYNGKNITIGAKDYVIFGSDENGAFALAQGDYLFVKADTELTSAKAVQKVVIEKAWVRDYDSSDGSFGADITANYNIYTAYSDDMGEEYFKNSFYGYLAYISRKVMFEQYVPAGQSTFIYDGEAKSITYSNENTLYKDVSSANGAIGLYAGHRLAVKSTKIGKEVGIYKDWLRLKVYDAASGADVTKLYNLECVNGDVSAAEIKAIEATLTVNSSVTVAALDGGSVISVSEYGGYNVLNSSEYFVSGLPQGYFAEIMVEKESGGYTFKVLLFELKESFGTVTRKEKSHCFDLSVNKPAGLTVNIVKSELPRA
ncbi:MAG: hypothetical protein K2L42_06970 [Clostridia bacterium]|nr:hypothetical protein [Clostridia bacterium]